MATWVAARLALRSSTLSFFNSRVTAGHCGSSLTKTMASNSQDHQDRAENPAKADGIACNGDVDDLKFRFSDKPTLEDIRKLQANFCNERNWNQFHTPRNLLLAMVGEVGELSEIFQWKGEVKEGLPDWSNEEKAHLGQELSDVLIYLLRLADKCKINLPEEAIKKIDMNRLKYPVAQAYGSSKKYDEFKNK